MKIDKSVIIALLIAGAIIVAATGHDGWGWLLTLAFLAML